MLRYVVAILAALVLLAAAPSAQAQYCWDTVCAAGTPAADCWRAYCSGSWSWPTYAPSYSAWSYPTYQSPYTWPAAPSLRLRMTPITQAQGCSTGNPVDWAIWSC